MRALKALPRSGVPLRTLRTWVDDTPSISAASAGVYPLPNNHCILMFFACVPIVDLIGSFYDRPCRAESKNRISISRIMARRKSANEIFISRMKEKMEERGLNQNNLAYMAKIGQSTISEYLNPEIGRNPGAAELGRLANTLGVTMGWLWGAEETCVADSIPAPIQTIFKLQGKLEFARKSMRASLAYLEDDIDDDHNAKVEEDNSIYNK